MATTQKETKTIIKSETIFSLLAGKRRNRFPVFHLLSDPNRFESSFASFSPIRPLRHWSDRRWINRPVAGMSTMRGFVMYFESLSPMNGRWNVKHSDHVAMNESSTVMSRMITLVSEAGHRVADTVTNNRLVNFGYSLSSRFIRFVSNRSRRLLRDSLFLDFPVESVETLNNLTLCFNETIHQLKGQF
jgi:hypothetical protein